MQMHQVGRELDLLADQVHLSINAILGSKNKVGLIWDVTWDCAAVIFFWGDKLRTPLNDAVIVLQQGGLDDNFDQW